MEIGYYIVVPPPHGWLCEWNAGKLGVKVPLKFTSKSTVNRPILDMVTGINWWMPAFSKGKNDRNRQFLSILDRSSADLSSQT